jgi:hypothetical protein
VTPAAERNWGQFELGMLDLFPSNLNKGNADFDIRQRVALSAIWDIRRKGGTKEWMKQVIGGGSLAPILLRALALLTASSAPPTLSRSALRRPSPGLSR